MNPHPRAPSTGLRAATSLFALAACIVAATTAFAQPAPAIPAKPGEAAGTVVVGKTTVTLKHAYATGPSDRGGPVYDVMLTDGPVPPEILAKGLGIGGAKALLNSGKLSGITMLVGADGGLRNIIPFAGDLRGEKMLASAGKLDSFAATSNGLTGQGRKALADTMGQGWSFAAGWNAAVGKP
jgi:hypothetical protein